MKCKLRQFQNQVMKAGIIDIINIQLHLNLQLKMHLSSKNILIGEVIPTYFKVRKFYMLDIKTTLNISRDVVIIVKVHLK